MSYHVVKKGECLASIAANQGFSDWQTIYKHPKNADFRNNRPDPNVIHPFDKLYIPDKEMRKESCSTEKHHRFRQHRPVIALRLVLLDEQRKPWINRRYKLEVENKQFEGRTNNEGLIDHIISPGASYGRLTVWLPLRESERLESPLQVDYVDQDDSDESTSSSGGLASQQPSQPSKQSGAAKENDTGHTDEEEAFDWDLEIGYLDPFEEVTGVQARSYNLGYNPGPIDGIVGPLTREAIRRFQKDNHLEVDGIPGTKTQAKLKELYGC